MALQNPTSHLSMPPSNLIAAAGMKLGSRHSRLLHHSQLAYFRKASPVSSPSKTVAYRNFKRLVPHAMNMTRGQSGYPEKFSHLYLEKVKNLWERCPEPIKVFPWDRAYNFFLHRIFMLTFEVAKWMFIPVLFVSSLSEIVYCGWQNKELLIPIGMLAGIYLAGVLKETAVELSENLQEGGFPWHLFIIGAFFALIKFPGPYYPYWGRIFLPHFANGGLWRTLWFAHMWHKSQFKTAGGGIRKGWGSKEMVWEKESLTTENIE